MWDFGKQKVKFGSKKAIFGVICFFLRGLDLAWESSTPPTHIWEKISKKTFLGGSPYPLTCSRVRYNTNQSIMPVRTNSQTGQERIIFYYTSVDSNVNVNKYITEIVYSAMMLHYIFYKIIISPPETISIFRQLCQNWRFNCFLEPLARDPRAMLPKFFLGG